MKPWPVSTHTNSTDHIEHLHALFSRLSPQDVQDFYNSYQHWMIQEHIQSLQEQIAIMQRRIHKNALLMEAVRPSAMGQAILARLRLHGVENVDVLDRMLEHDDDWLNHTLELLEQCEYLGFIQDDYTQWCEYALDGAYDWLTSITITGQDIHNDSSDQQSVDREAISAVATASEHPESDLLPQVTEEELLQKLMSDEDDETIKLPVLHSPTTPIPSVPTNEHIHMAQIATSFSAAPTLTTHQPVAITRKLPIITQPLPILEEEDVVGARFIAPSLVPASPTKIGEEASISSPPTSIAIAPQRGPLWRFFNLLARFFFAT